MAADLSIAGGSAPFHPGPADIARAFERAPALVERLAREGPYASVDEAIARARALLAAMSERERIALLDAHPRIGAHAALLSPDSLREQGTAADAAVEATLAVLNDAYERRFGFRFVVFVNRRTRAQIVPILRGRLERPREEELATGIEEVLAIARDRLERA